MTTKRKGWLNHGIKGPESIADHIEGWRNPDFSVCRHREPKQHTYQKMDLDAPEMKNKKDPTFKLDWLLKRIKANSIMIQRDIVNHHGQT
ncbi:hypothetical protein L6452_09000 [Arctium lappa]|uniref:Uncharacterized protein n=1 Tax=Arctium lappa TaxID=4217 RepID=A0ACB9DJA5_ARCLA|nr:hypothetical protein L6452_09000 [Arctium lappa]